MKSPNDIQNVEVRKEIVELLGLFEDSFLNNQLEFIAIYYFYFHKFYDQQELWFSGDVPYRVQMPKRPIMVNLYFLTSNCQTKKDVQCKLLEYFSRACFKTPYMDNECLDELIHQYIRNRINIYLHTNFTKDDFEKIYCELGNGVNRAKTIKFIDSCFDLSVL